MKRMFAVAALTIAAASLALGQMTGQKAHYSNQKGDTVEQAVMQMEEEAGQNRERYQRRGGEAWFEY